MKKTILTTAALLLGFAAAAADLTGTWSFNPWKGYKPLPKMDNENGTIHVYDVNGKYGFALKSKEKIAVKAGDRVKFTAMVKGKGKMFFQLQDFDANGKWIGVAPRAARAELPADWKEITLSVKVENHKERVTGFSIASIGAGKGSEMYFKNSRAEVETSEYAGDYRFPRHWTVFAPVPGDTEAPLDRIPSEIGGVKGKSVPLDNNLIILAPFFPERKLRNTAWLYAELNAPSAGTYTIGAGADYFMAIYLNGKCVLDTLKSGDDSNGPHFSTHKINVQIKRGKNLIAVKFQSGSGPRPAISLGGADDLRNLSSILTVTETYAKDDYEKPGERSGDPKLIKGTVTDGIEALTGQGVYKSGSVIAFPGKTYPMPPKIGGKLFAVGLRLHKFSGAGEIVFRIGKNRTLSVGRPDAISDLTMTVRQDGKKLKSAVLPIIALPSDIIFAADAAEYYVNALSLQDSKLRSITGRAPFTEKLPFTADVEVKTDSVTVDEFFTGLAKREVKSNTVPFKIALDSTFDPVKAGWKLIWQDEFNGDKVDWENTWMNSPWSPVPRDRDMAFLKDGMLHIRAEFRPDPKNPKLIRGRTVGLYSQKRFGYGYYEARVRFTRKKGWWAAFWMLDEGRNMSVGGGYEIDIFEDYSTRGGKKTVANNLHVNYGPGSRSYGYHFQLPGSMDDFYTIGCKWTPFEVSVYLNGKLIRSSSRHSPYQSATYDGINHGFCTATLYVCLSGQCSKSGVTSNTIGSEEYLVDWVRAYEYPRQNDPEIFVREKPAKSMFRTGEKMTFEIGSAPNAQTKSPVKNVYLFDNGNLIDYKNGSSGKFDFAIDMKHYADTTWNSAGRSGRKVVLDTYPHLFSAAVQDENGNVAYTPVFPVICDMGDSHPYKGIRPIVPGTIDTAKYDEGGNGAATYKQKRRGGTFDAGQEGLFSRKALNLREAGKWANFSFKNEKDGRFNIILKRGKYRVEWPLRALVLIDGIYIGDFIAKENAGTAVIKGVKLSAGKHRLTLISGCAYGVWPTALEFEQQ